MYQSLASSSFILDDQRLAVVDPYTASGETINSYQTVLTEDQLKAIPLLTPATKPILSLSDNKQLTTDPASLTARLSLTIPSVIKDLRTATSAIRSGVMTANAIKNQITLVQGNINKIVKSGDLGSLLGVAKCIDTVAKSATSIYSIVDKAGVSGIVSGLTREATALGIPNAFSNIAAGISDRTILIGAAKNLINEGVNDIRILADIANTPIIKELGIIKPKTLNNIVRRSSKAGSDARQLLGAWGSVETLLTRVNGNYNKTKRGSTTILDASVFNGIDVTTRSCMRKSTSELMSPTAISVGGKDIMDLSDLHLSTPDTAYMCTAATMYKDTSQISAPLNIGDSDLVPIPLLSTKMEYTVEV